MLAGCFSCALFLIKFQAFSIRFKYGKLPGHSQICISLSSWSIILQKVVAFIDVPDGEHMLLQNLQIVGSIQGNDLGEEERIPICHYFR